MAIREILKLGHPTLTRKADPVETIDAELRALAMDMVETMRAAPGLGLSAPQVNVSKRLITVDPLTKEKKAEAIILVNPEIIFKEGRCVRDEGCLSIPDVYEKVARPQKIKIQGLDLDGRRLEIEATDFLARTFCHEIDHLDGKLFIDWLSPLKRNLIKKRFRKAGAKKA
jgi:peptide deformylase